MKLWLKVTKMSYKCEMKCNWTSAQGHQISTNLRKTLHSETQTFKETKQQKQSVLQGCQTDRKFIKSKTTKFDPDACKWGWSDDAMNFLAICKFLLTTNTDKLLFKRMFKTYIANCSQSSQHQPWVEPQA